MLRVLGRAASLEILLEGHIRGAREACEKGLVSRVVADAEVVGETYATARRWWRAGTRNSSAGWPIPIR